MASAHIKVVINYSQFDGGATIDQEVAFAQSAASVGIGVVWPVGYFRYSSDGGTDIPSQFAALSNSMASRCSGAHTNYWFVRCFASIVGAESGTWGYYVGDELPTSVEWQVRHMVDAVYSVDSRHPRLYVASDPGGYANTGALTAYGRHYSDGRYNISDATVIAQDFYPIGTGLGSQAASRAGSIAHQLRTLASSLGDSYAMVLQAHSLAEYPSLYTWCHGTSNCPYPSVAQMQAMRAAVVAQGVPSVLLWYSYFDVVRGGRLSDFTAGLA